MEDLRIVPANEASWEDLQTVFGTRGSAAICQCQRFKTRRHERWLRPRQPEGEAGANDLIGTEADLNRNLLALIAVAGLTEEEAREFGRLQRERISRYSQRRG